MHLKPSRLADWVDRLHAAVVLFWLSGFLVPIGTHPRFRLWHAVFILVGAIHQILLRNRCILTIVSDRLRTQDPAYRETAEPFFIDRYLARFGIRYPHWINTVITGLTVLGAIYTLYRLLA